MHERPVTFYWPGTSSFRADGTLVMRATGYEGDRHWTGEHVVAPDDQDYAMWCSFRTAFRTSPPTLAIITSEALEYIRETFRAEKALRAEPRDRREPPEKPSFRADMGGPAQPGGC